MIGLDNIQHGMDSLGYFLIFMLNHDGHGMTRTVPAALIVLVLAIISFPRTEEFHRSRLLVLFVFPVLWIAQITLGGIFAREFLLPDDATRDLLTKIPLGLLALFAFLWLYLHVNLENARWFVFVIAATNLIFMFMATFFALMQISGDAI